MVRKLLRGAGALALSAALLLAAVGCGGRSGAKDKAVSLYLLNPFMTQALLPYLTEQFPDVTFTFMAGDNGTDHLAMLAERGDLPDIFMVNGAGKDLGTLGAYCYDLEETEVAASIYSGYRSRFTNPDGTIYVLPSLGEPSGVLANRALFDAHGIPLPTDYNSFISACRRFGELGIRGYAPDGKYAISLSTMMVDLGAERLASVEGATWLSDYENGVTDEFASQVWLPVFESTAQLVADGGFDLDSVTHNDAGYGYNDMWNGMREGTTAMIRGVVSSVTDHPDDFDGDLVLIPWFAPGADQDTAFALVEAGQGYCAGISKAAMEDPKRAELVLAVYEAIYSQGALQSLVDVYGGGWLSFTDRATVDLPDKCENLRPYIDRNHLVLMLDKHAQDALAAGFRAMVLEGRTPAAALNTANETLQAALSKAGAAPEPEEVLLTSSAAYSAVFDSRTGCQTASVIANTVREYLGAEVLLNPYVVQNAPVYAMDYTADQVGELCAPGSYRVMLGDVTGAELLALAKASVEADGYPDAPVCDSALPVVSGGKLTVKRTGEGYLFQGLTVGGQPVEEDRTYHIAAVDYDGASARFATAVMEPMGLLERFEIYEGNSYMRSVFLSAVQERGGFAEPSDYIEFAR